METARTSRWSLLRLRRIVASESWVPEIDGLRFLAVLAVLLFHCSGEVGTRGLAPLGSILPHWMYVVGNGDRGVVLFFVISGFVLARPFYAQYRLGSRRIRLGQYFLRRVTRLEPPYLVSLLLYMAVACVVAPMFRHAIVVHTGISALYIHNLVYPTAPTSPNFVTWSLEVEIQFYILAPLLAHLFRIPTRWQRRAALAAITLAGCVWSALHPHPPITLLTYAGFFPAGFLLADFFDDRGQAFAKDAPRSFVWDLVGLLLWSAFFVLPPSFNIRAFLPFVIVPACLTVFRGRVLRWLFSRPFLTTFGGMCYSIYLLHPLTMSASFRIVKHVRFLNPVLTYLVELALLLSAILVVSTIFFVFVERPCMRKRWPQEVWAKLAPRAESAR